MNRPAQNGVSKLAFVDPTTFTPQFSWRKTRAKPGADTEVQCESVPLTSVAEKYGTPTYVYSNAAIGQAYRELEDGLGSVPHTLCFAVKSNGNLTILNSLAKRGSGFDIVSGGELHLLGLIGVRGDRIVFSGVGKSREEIREALSYRTGGKGPKRGILLFNIESEAELEILLEEASRAVKRSGAIPAVAIRVNPDVQAGGHPHISTGRHEHKFGLDWVEARRLYLAHRNSRWIHWQGISAHIGSQITSLGPFRQAVKRLISFAGELDRHGVPLRFLDIGGGLGVRYLDQKPPSRTEYARLVAQLTRGLGLHLLLEPGRSIIGPAGVLLTRVVYTKTNRGKKFVVTDAAMNDLMRPALYGAIHPITKITRNSSEAQGEGRRADIVGPVCETGDCFLRDWPIGEVKSGDLLAIWGAGAYGMSQTSNYNARPRPAEVRVQGKRSQVIRRRETYKDLVRLDVLA
jgi:diaminopimelate decarboxylase